MADYFVNAQLALRGEFSKRGALVPVSASLTVRAPSGATTTYTPSGATGVAEQVITPTEAGVWSYAYTDLNTGAYAYAIFEVMARPV